MNAARTIFALAVSLIIAGNLLAVEEKQAPEGKHPHRAMIEHGAMIEHWAMLKDVNLNDDQKVKVEVIKQEYGPKLKEVRVTIDAVLTDEQRKAREEAVKAARAAGKRGQEVFLEAKAAVTLTDEQKAKMAEARKAMQAIRQEAREKIMAILTPEQREQIGKPHHAMRGRHELGWGGEILKGLNLSTEQQAKIDDLKKEYSPKFQEARKQVQSLRREVREKVLAYLTPEQKEQLKQENKDSREQEPEGK